MTVSSVITDDTLNKSSLADQQALAKTAFSAMREMAANEGFLADDEIQAEIDAVHSVERYNELAKAERNAAYLRKLERGLAQVQAGHGIVKTMEELKVMESDGR